MLRNICRLSGGDIGTRPGCRRADAAKAVGAGGEVSLQHGSDPVAETKIVAAWKVRSLKYVRAGYDLHVTRNAISKPKSSDGNESDLRERISADRWLREHTDENLWGMFFDAATRRPEAERSLTRR